MEGDLRPWWGRFSILQLVIATVAIFGLLVALWLLAPGDLPLFISRCLIGYQVFMGLWTTRRVARSLAASLEHREAADASGLSAFARAFEAALLPLYCAAVPLVVAIVTLSASEPGTGPFLADWYGTLSYVGTGFLGVIGAAIALLSIWRRCGRAGFIAVTVAQGIGAAAVAAGFFLALPALRSVDEHDTWYYLQAIPAGLWLVFLMICATLGMIAVVRLWCSIAEDLRFPWGTVLYLILFIGYLAGVGKLTGFWVSSWLYGGFFMARLSTYVFFALEPKGRPVWRSGWFACYGAALVMGIVTTAHQMATGNFAMMMQPLLMMPLPPVGMMSSPWAFSLSMLLTLTRDILFLLWLNRLARGWGEAVGFVALGLLYGPIALGIDLIGWQFLFPVLYPLFVGVPVDLLWPLGMIGLLFALNLRSRRDFQENSSLA